MTAMKEPLLTLSDVTLRSDGRELLSGIDLAVDEGDIHAVIGANGAGKSTLAYTLMGCEGFAPDAGEIHFAGERIDGLPLHERARRGLTLAWQEPARFEGLAVAQFLNTGAPETDADEALTAVGLTPAEYRHRLLDKRLSGGERKRIELAGILTLAPRLAILDEPTAGIDLLSVEEIVRLIETLREKGTAVLLITHQEALAARADRATQLCGGRIVCRGTPQAVIENFKARRCTRCDGQRCADG